MEAANLGAFAGDAPRLDHALARLAAVPSFGPSVADWASLALQVREELVPARGEAGVSSVGIPTWFYGHEPPNVFCDGIAKYFSNAIREDGLLMRSTAGVIVLEGAAGTVQEIFQAVTPLFYASQRSPRAPLVLVGRDYWSGRVPVWPALQALGALADDPVAPGAAGLSSSVHLVDSVGQAADLVLSSHPGGGAGPRREGGRGAPR
jgi:hypothetical protein